MDAISLTGLDSPGPLALVYRVIYHFAVWNAVGFAAIAASSQRECSAQNLTLAAENPRDLSRRHPSHNRLAAPPAGHRRHNRISIEAIAAQDHLEFRC
jgi:hypothetical protein